MSARFLISWSEFRNGWVVLDQRDNSIAAEFPTLLEAETYVIERSKRVER